MNTRSETLKAFMKSKSKRTSEAYLDALRNFGTPELEEMLEVNVNDVVSWVAAQREKHSSATVRRRFSNLKTMFKFMQHRRWIDLNPFDDPMINLPVVVTQKPAKYINPATVARALTLDDPLKRYAFTFLFSTGARKGEFLAVKKSDFEWSKNPVCWLYNSKCKRRETVEILPWAAGVIAARCEEVGENDLLCDVSRKTLDKWCHLHLGASPHATRATAITTLFMAGCPAEEVQLFARHKSILETLKYRRIAPKNPARKHLHYPRFA